MGLDMYLYAEKYVTGYAHRGEQEAEQYNAIVELVDGGGIAAADSPHLEVKLCVAYWRKANQIHAWFVKNVQDGIDDCRTAEVGREQLEELVGVCYQVLAAGTDRVKHPVQILESDGKVRKGWDEGETLLDPGLAEELLPTQSGFFFGSIEFDHWYVADLRDTVRQLERALTAGRGWDFYYRSSW